MIKNLIVFHLTQVHDNQFCLSFPVLAGYFLLVMAVCLQTHGWLCCATCVCAYDCSITPHTICCMLQIRMPTMQCVSKNKTFQDKQIVSRRGYDFKAIGPLSISFKLEAKRASEFREQLRSL